MTTEVRYTTQWNPMTRRPIAGHEWLDQASARALFEAGGDLNVVDAARTDDDGLPQPRWLLGIGSSGRIRAQFFDEHGSVVRLVDYDRVDGRLWRWVTVDYTYPTDSERHNLSDVTVETEAAVRPDGHGHLSTENATTGQESRLQFSDGGRDEYWVPVPEFGDWAALSKPGPSAQEVAGSDSALTV